VQATQRSELVCSQIIPARPTSLEAFRNIACSDQQLAEKGHATPQARDLGCKPSIYQIYDRYVTTACDMIEQQDGTESSMCLTLWVSDA
jgi:hypothetical protein